MWSINTRHDRLIAICWLDACLPKSLRNWSPNAVHWLKGFYCCWDKGACRSQLYVLCCLSLIIIIVIKLCAICIVLYVLYHYIVATLPGMWDRTVTIGSAGKTFSVTGWKLGWSIGPKHLIHSLCMVHQNCNYTCPTPLQVIDLHALH